mmetsp:Transcript_1221/g.2505  ORF Transcript_1221/g.2505 Transcript_1221/m.2505 type:complete len:211 (+) Transcript_1221:809-1441(+)
MSPMSPKNLCRVMRITALWKYCCLNANSPPGRESKTHPCPRIGVSNADSGPRSTLSSASEAFRRFPRLPPRLAAKPAKPARPTRPSSRRPFGPFGNGICGLLPGTVRQSWRMPRTRRALGFFLQTFSDVAFTAPLSYPSCVRSRWKSCRWKRRLGSGVAFTAPSSYPSCVRSSLPAVKVLFCKRSSSSSERSSQRPFPARRMTATPSSLN